MIKQLLDEVEQNMVICQWRADQLFADAEGNHMRRCSTIFNVAFIFLSGFLPTSFLIVPRPILSTTPPSLLGLRASVRDILRGPFKYLNFSIK